MITLTQPCTMPEEQLTGTQQTALSSLILGNTVSEAAGEAGVHRNTVHRWLKSDEPFQEARRQTQREAQRTVEAKLHDTASAAIDCIEKCLQEGDAYVAEQLLKGLGCLDGDLKDLGSEDAVTLAREALQHSALGEMLGVGPGLPGQFETVSMPEGTGAPGENLQHDAPSEERHVVPSTQYPAPPETDFAPDLRAASEGVQTAETSGQARTYDPQHTAPSDDGYADLTTQQATAMMALQTGQTITEAAETAETDPAAVYQWLRGDCTFQAAMNRCAKERRRAIRARLDQLASLAADVVHHKITQGNGHLAVKLLKGLGYLGDAKRAA